MNTKYSNQSVNEGLAYSHPFPVQESALAPIALFVYKRAEHTRQTVEFLTANDMASRSALFVFADAAKSASAVPSVAVVRKLIRTIKGFRSVTIVERERNLGLAGSVIDGVTQLCKQFGRVIVVEDDLLTSSDFLTFMNRALERYSNDPRVFSVSGFNYGVTMPKDYSYDAYFSYRSSSWGWGTWKDRWEKADWTISDYAGFRSSKNMQALFNRGGQDLSHMLAMQMAGHLDSWAIRWAYAHWKHEAFALLSTKSKVLNIGLDGSGVHCRANFSKQSPLLAPNDGPETRFPLTVNPEPRFAEEIRRAHKVSLPRMWARSIYRSVRNRRRRPECFHQQ